MGSAGYEALAAQVPLWPKLTSLFVLDETPPDALGRALGAALRAHSLPNARFFQILKMGEGAIAELREAKATSGSKVKLVLLSSEMDPYYGQ